MSELWKQWVGRTVDGKFPLQSYLGGSDHSAVFLTQLPTQGVDSKNAAIKLVSADSADAEEQLLRWKAIRELDHPNLIRIFEAGRCCLDESKLLYVVEEYAEENLLQILPERGLTAEETRGMLPPVLSALHFVHERDFVHGHIQPSNIFAIGDQVKLSSDGLIAQGETARGAEATGRYDPPEAATGGSSTAGDVWQLGMTLTEVLTQRLPTLDRSWRSTPDVPTAVPEPFREIVEGCLQHDVGKRWTVGRILDRLGGTRPTTASVATSKATPTPTSKVVVASAVSDRQKPSAKWRYVVGLAAVVAVASFFIARPKSSNAPTAQSTQDQEGSGAANSRPANTSTQHEPDAGGDEKKTTTNAGGEGGVMQQVMPEVSASARRTIHGKIVVRVKVNVDAAGNVTAAKIESGRGSRYFSRVALDAARDWKFSPVPNGEQPGDREWKLQFAFTRAKTEASVVGGKR